MLIEYIKTEIKKMLTDSVITLPSAWCLDNILLSDVSPESWKYSPERNSSETDLYHVEESGLDRIKQFHDYCGLAHTSTGTSIASSECSDDLYLDLDGDTEADLFGDLASSVLNIIQDIQESGSEEIELFTDSRPESILSFCDSCSASSSDKCDTRPLVDSSSCDNNDTRSNNNHCSCDKCSRLSFEDSSTSVSTEVSCDDECSIDVACTGCSCRRRNRKNKKWSDLNEAEKVTVVDELSLRISRDLGLREQLEVIRMIDPKSHASPTDKQFLIDITNMTEEKIEKIQDYIKTHCCIECQSDDNSLKSSPRKSKKRQMSTERKNRHKHDRQRQRKEYRQILKERRSGLFVKEEVLSMSRLTPPPEEEDIDIVG